MQHDEFYITHDFAELMSGHTGHHPMYVEAAKSMDDADDRSINGVRNMMTEVQSFYSSNRKKKKDAIMDSEGVLTDLPYYKRIDQVLDNIAVMRLNPKLHHSLDQIRRRMIQYQEYYKQGYARNIQMIMMEYEGGADLLVTGTTMIALAYVDKYADEHLQKNTDKYLSYNGLIAKTIHDFAEELMYTGHKDYLEAVIKAEEGIGFQMKKESTMFTEGNILAGMELFDALMTNIGKIGKYTVNAIKSIKRSIFGIVPLIRTCLYLRFKKKADTVMNLEQQAMFIQQHTEQLEKRTNLDPKEKEILIKKQRAIAEQYRKRAERLRASLTETERTVAKEIKQSPTPKNPPKPEPKKEEQKKEAPRNDEKKSDSGKKSTGDDDFVLESSLDLDAGFRLGFYTESKKPRKNTPMSPDQIVARRMSIIRKNGPASVSSVRKSPEIPSAELRRQIDKALAEVIKTTKRDSIRITLNDGLDTDSDPDGRFKSKFGGMPYWPAKKKYPLGGKDGKTPMILLAQINFAEMPRLTGYPSKGILQFFCCNVDWMDDNSSKNVRTIYHPNVSTKDPQFDDITRTTCNYDDTKSNRLDWCPIEKVFYFKSTKKEAMSAQPGCPAFDDKFEEVFNRIGPARIHGHDVTAHSVWDYVYDYFKDQPSWGHRIGGWPNFVQNDVTDEKYNTLLLQIDSDREIMWGDVGIANTFINDKALSALDFSDVLYTWDCG